MADKSIKKIIIEQFHDFFAIFTRINLQVGISDICTYDQDGYKYSNPVFPFKFTLKPTGQVQFSKKAPPTMEAFMYQFTRIPNHTRLYTLIAFLHPWDKNGIVLGDLELTSKCVTSTYGDKKLFFRHQYIEDDVKLRPQWADAYFKDCYCNYNKRKWTVDSVLLKNYVSNLAKHSHFESVKKKSSK